MRRRTWVAIVLAGLGIGLAMVPPVVEETAGAMVAGVLLLVAVGLFLSLLPIWGRLVGPLPPMPDLFRGVGSGRWCATCGHAAPRRSACPTCGQGPRARVRKAGIGGKGEARAAPVGKVDRFAEGPKGKTDRFAEGPATSPDAALAGSADTRRAKETSVSGGSAPRQHPASTGEPTGSGQAMHPKRTFVHQERKAKR